MPIRCIEKTKDKRGRITDYLLVDEKGNRMPFTSEELHNAMRRKYITVTNLILTKDNKIREIAEISNDVDDYKVKAEKYIQQKLAKVKLMGGKVLELKAADKKSFYVWSKSNTEHIIYIPADVIDINSNNEMYTTPLRKLQGTIVVYGGRGLTDIGYMFYGFQAKYIDLQYFDTSNVTNMMSLFYCSNVEKIYFYEFDTHKVTNMSLMFSKCQHLTELDLSSFNTRNVVNMEGMFEWCSVHHLDLSNFDTKCVATFEGMFVGCEFDKLNIKSFSTSTAVSFKRMFRGCTVKGTFDLTHFDTHNVGLFSEMFSRFSADVLDLTSFCLDKAIGTYNMLECCNAKIIRVAKNNTRLLEELKQADFLKSKVVKV